jgi:hypothetical protein
MWATRRASQRKYLIPLTRIAATQRAGHGGILATLAYLYPEQGVPGHCGIIAAHYVV